jgi:hypothetical protein
MESGDEAMHPFFSETASVSLNPILAGTAEGLLSRLGTEGRDWLDDSYRGAEAPFLPS